jgi:hypothetical protein
MADSQVTHGENGLALSVLNKQSRTADKMFFQSGGFELETKKYSP